MGGLRLPTCFFKSPAWEEGSWSPTALPLLLPVPLAFSTRRALTSGRFGGPGLSPSPVSWAVPPGEPLGAKISTASALPHPLPPPTRLAAAPPSSPGLWDRERAEGLALHTNVLPIVKAPLCPGAPLRRLRGGHNGGSVPEFPQTVTCFQSLPPPPPSPSPTESKRLFYTSVFLLLSCIQGYRYHLSTFTFTFIRYEWPQYVKKP